MTLALFSADMLPPSKTKICQTCRRQLGLTSFPHHNGSHDGRRRHCRACLLAGHYSPRIENREQRAARDRRQSREEWRRSHRAALAKCEARNPIKAKAVRALQAALKSGRVVKAEQCQARGCSSQHKIEGHHWDYRPENWLSVLWVCAAHHRQGHARGFIEPAEGIDLKFGRIPDLEIEETEQAA